MLQGSKLSLNVPFIRVGSCSIIVIHDLRSLIRYSMISLSSIRILPRAGYNILSMQLMSVDLPAPVLPTIPTLSPAEILILTFLITKGNYYRYLAE